MGIVVYSSSMRYILLLLILIINTTSTTVPLSVLSSCNKKSSDQWNTDTTTIATAVSSWLYSVVTVRGGGSSVQSMLYHPHTGEFSDHYAHYNDQMEEKDPLVDKDRRVVTIGTFTKNSPTGLTW